MEDLVIRNTLEEDFIKIAELGEECEPMETESNQVFHIFTKYFRSTCFVAELSSGGIAGFILGFISPENKEESYIHLLCVDPKKRKLNIGRKLMDAFIEMANLKECKIVKLITKPINWNAITFYKKLGFQEEKSGETMNVLGTTAIKNYDGPGEHMVVFYKSLEK
ncbi:MAG: GNAT family N-acetyltransferase [Methanobacterium sp.]